MPHRLYRNYSKTIVVKGDFIFSPKILKELNILDWAYTDRPAAVSFERYERWVEKGEHAQLSYLEGDRLQKRKSITHYFPEFQSAFVFLFDYLPEKKALEDFYRREDRSNDFKVGSYALSFSGEDYHYVLRNHLEKLASEVKKKASSEVKILFSLDTQPILERDLAYRAGLGWFGKNSMLISKEHGSFFIIGSILVDQKFNLEKRVLDSDHCGTCLACVEACPTDAIDPITRTVNAKMCIPNFTIELFKDSDPPEGYDKMEEIFGCDICQDVCPWNTKIIDKAQDHQWSKKQGELLRFFLDTPKGKLEEKLSAMSKKEYQRTFKGTSLERTGRDGLIKNLKYKN